MKQYFYGIYGIQFIYHGDWADPELKWHGKSFNYYEIEAPLWETYKEDCENPNEDDFATWIKKNAYLVRECLQNLLECKCFYGGDK